MFKFVFNRTDSTTAAWGPSGTVNIGPGQRVVFVEGGTAAVYTTVDGSGNLQLNISAALAQVNSAAITGLEATDLDDNVEVSVFAISGDRQQLIFQGTN